MGWQPARLTDVFDGIDSENEHVLLHFIGDIGCWGDQPEGLDTLGIHGVARYGAAAAVVKAWGCPEGTTEEGLGET